MKIVIPEEGVKAALGEWTRNSTPGCAIAHGLERFAKWLAENPIVPTDAMLKMCLSANVRDGRGRLMNERQLLTEFQKYMFLAPEDLFERDCADLNARYDQWAWIEKDAMREAYERGRKAGSK